MYRTGIICVSRMPEDPEAETRFHVNLLKRLLREQAESTGRLARAKKATEIFLYYLTCTDWVKRHETLHADILRKAKALKNSICTAEHAVVVFTGWLRSPAMRL
jgi:hypothetical protein